MVQVERKNYSFYMATDFVEKLEKVQESSPDLKHLSRSQAVYFIISNMAKAVETAEQD